MGRKHVVQIMTIKQNLNVLVTKTWCIKEIYLPVWDRARQATATALFLLPVQRLTCRQQSRLKKQFREYFYCYIYQ
jgi:hypothetical protein